MQAVEEKDVVIELQDEHLPDAVRTRLVRRLAGLRSRSATAMIDAAFSSVAKRLGIAALIAPVNPAAPFWLLSGARTKERAIRARTARSGLRAGLVCRPRDGDPIDLRPLTIQLERRALRAVQRSGKELWTLAERSTDRPLRVGTSCDGRLVTSDVDIVSLCYRKGTVTEKPMIEHRYGHLLRHEKDVIDAINERFLELAKQRYNGRVAAGIRLCTHGPSSRFDHPNLASPVFPMRAFLPGGEIEVIGARSQRTHTHVREWRAKLERMGFVVPWNPRWTERT